MTAYYQQIDARLTVTVPAKILTLPNMNAFHHFLQAFLQRRYLWQVFMNLGVIVNLIMKCFSCICSHMQHLWCIKAQNLFYVELEVDCSLQLLTLLPGAQIEAALIQCHPLQYLSFQAGDLTLKCAWQAFVPPMRAMLRFDMVNAEGVFATFLYQILDGRADEFTNTDRRELIT